MQRLMVKLKMPLVAVLALALAAFSGAHALSSANARRGPEVALAVWPWNGQARERLAYSTFLENLRKTLGISGTVEPATSETDSVLEQKLSRDNGLLQKVATESSAAARRALRYDPLLPHAHVLLALSENDPVRREAIIALASRLNRRNLALRSLVLQSRVEAGDYPGTIDTLDQILRVHPERQGAFFPLLTNALRQKTTTKVFRDLLSRPLPWRDNFLAHAVADPAAARNLAVIRQSTDFDNSEFDRVLISTLAANGDLDIAARLYRQFGKSDHATTGLAWPSAYPPFDWTFGDEAGLRAQPGKDGRYLEFAIDPGSGGVLASRIVAPRSQAFAVLIRYQLDNPSLGKDLKLSLTCAGQTQPFFTSTLAERKERFDVDQGSGCSNVILALSGRSWSGGEALEGSITSLLIDTQ